MSRTTGVMQWDSLGKRYVEVGATRWVVEWTVWRSKEHIDDEDGLLEDRMRECRHIALSKAHALHRARKIIASPPPLLCWHPRIRQEVFEGDANGPGVGWWEPSGEWEEVES